MSSHLPREPSCETCPEKQDAVVPSLINKPDITRKGALVRLVIFCLILAFGIKPIWWSSGGDTIFYLGVSRWLWEHGELLIFGKEQIFNQIGLCLFYCPAFAFGERPFLVLSILQWLASVGALVGCYHWFRKFLGRDDSVLLTGLVFLTACFWIYYLRFLTETWACCLLFALAVIYQKTVAAMQKQNFSHAWLWLLASLPVMVWAVLTRNVIAFLAVGFGIVMLLLGWQMRCRKVWFHGLSMAVLLNLVAGATGCGWLIYQDHQKDLKKSENMSYVNFVKNDVMSSTTDSTSVLTLVADSIHLRTTMIGRAMVPGMFRTYPETGQWLHPLTWLNILISLVIVWGYVLLARSSLDAFVWMVPFYALLVLLLPYGAGTRFLIPVMPVVILSLYRCTVGLTWQKKALLILFVLHFVVMVGRVLSVFPQEITRHQQWELIDRVALRIQQISTTEQWASVGIDSDWSNMLAFSAKQFLKEWDPAQSDAPTALYLVLDTHSQVPVPDGYVLLDNIENYHLYKRQ